MRHAILAATALLVAGCGFDGTGGRDDTDKPAKIATEPVDPLASHDPAPGQAAHEIIADAGARPVMQLQVVLERQGFGPGVIDGELGLSTRNAIAGFQQAHGIAPSGKPDAPTLAALRRWSNIPATRVVTIPASWGKIRFAPVSHDPAAQAKLPELGYASLEEKLAERFHTTVEVLAQLNPGGRPAQAGRAIPSASPTPETRVSFRAGQLVRVPNIGADRIDPGLVEDKPWLATLISLGVGTDQAKAARIVVSRSRGTLKAYAADDTLVALFTVTSGSRRDPLPLGHWGINVVAKNPPFAYNPKLFWDVPDHKAKQQLPPGPNGPVGVVWIDLTKEHYGIHGTPEPQTIGRTQSHGCVRLTNWDAARLAQMVSTSTKVVFER